MSRHETPPFVDVHQGVLLDPFVSGGLRQVLDGSVSDAVVRVV